MTQHDYSLSLITLYMMCAKKQVFIEKFCHEYPNFIKKIFEKKSAYFEKIWYVVIDKHKLFVWWILSDDFSTKNSTENLTENSTENLTENSAEKFNGK